MNINYNQQDINSNYIKNCIYHEKQVAALCAVHAINNLLQSKTFNEIDFMHIAHQLDAKEAEILNKEDNSPVPLNQPVQIVAHKVCCQGEFPPTCPNIVVFFFVYLTILLFVCLSRRAALKT